MNLWNRVLLTQAAVALAVVLGHTKCQAQPSMFKNRQTLEISVAPVDSKQIDSRYLVRPRLNILRKRKVKFNLPSGETFTLKRQRYNKERVRSTGYHRTFRKIGVSGTVHNSQNSTVGEYFVSQVRGKDGQGVYATIRAGDKSYIMRSAPALGGIVVEKIKSGYVKDFYASESINRLQGRALDSEAGLTTLNVSQLRKTRSGRAGPLQLVVAYTEEAENQAGGISPFYALLYHEMYRLDERLKKVGSSVELVQSLKVRGSSSQSTMLDLLALKDPKDGRFDSAVRFKRFTGAHLLTLFTAAGDSCGAGYSGDAVDSTSLLHPDWMLSILHTRCPSLVQAVAANIGGIVKEKIEKLVSVETGEEKAASSSNQQAAKDSDKKKKKAKFIVQGYVRDVKGVGLPHIIVDGGVLGRVMTDSDGFYQFLTAEKGQEYLVQPLPTYRSPAFIPVSSSVQVKRKKNSADFRVNGAPVIEAISDKIIVTGSVYSRKLVVSDPEGEPVKLSGEIRNIQTLAFNLDSRFDFSRVDENDSFDLRGKQEKYLTTAGGDIFFILPNGEFYLLTFSGDPVVGSPELELLDRQYFGTFPDDFYEDVGLFVDVEKDSGANSASLSIEGTELTVTPLSEFNGTVEVVITATDGSSTDEESFFLTVKNDPPVLGDLGDIVFAHGQPIKINVPVHDPEGQEVALKAQVASIPELVSRLDSRYDFYIARQGLYFNARGASEHYIRGTAGSGWFYILPDGELYEHLGDELENRKFLAKLPKRFYNDPSLLVDRAKEGDLLRASSVFRNINENQIEISVTEEFTGDLRIDLQASDGTHTIEDEFYVTVVNTAPEIRNASVPLQVSHGGVLEIPVDAFDAEGADLEFKARIIDVNKLAGELDRTFDFYLDSKGFFENARGGQEKYLRAVNGSTWFFILPNGDFFEFVSTLQNSTLLGTFPVAFYQDPSLLVDVPAARGTAPATLLVQGNIVAVRPDISFEGIFQVEVSVSDGAETTTEVFSVEVTNTAPTQTQVADIQAAHGSVINIPLEIVDPESVAYTVSATMENISKIAFDIDQKYDFYVAPQGFYTNARGAQEKYIRSPIGSTWYFITPQGALYEFAGATLSDGVLIANLPARYYENPFLLVDVAEPESGVAAQMSVTNELITISPVVSFVGTLKVTVEAFDGAATSQQSFYVTVNNQAPLFPGIADRVIPHGQQLQMETVASDPEGLPLNYQAKVINLDATAFQLDRVYDFYIDRRGYFENVRGGNERYIRGAGGTTWFYILPTGALYELVGDFASSTFLAQFPSSYYNDPSRLVDVPLPDAGAPAVASFSGSSLTVVPDIAYVGVFLVEISVSDGADTSLQSFALEVTNQAPVQQQVENTNLIHGNVLQLNLEIEDPENMPFTTSATVEDVAASVHELDKIYDFYIARQGVYLNARGGQEKYVRGSYGSTWYYILPDGQLFELVTTTLEGNRLIASLPATYYANPYLLVDVPASQFETPGLVDIDGNQLSLMPAIEFDGTMRVTVRASDKADISTQEFFVTIINTAPVVEKVDDMTASHGKTQTIPVSITDAENVPLSLTASVSDLANDIYSVDQTYDFYVASQGYFTNARGENEKYLRGVNGSTWFFILPDGRLFHFDSDTLTTSSLLLQLPVSFYADPSQLVDSPAGALTAPAEVGVNDIQSVTVTPQQGFVGTVKIDLEASDGAARTSSTFFLTFENAAPVFSSLPDQTFNSGDPITFALSATDAQNDALYYSVSVETEEELLYKLDQVHNFILNSSGFIENGRGANERYFRGSQGSGWYYILPDGAMYLFGSSLTDSTLLARVGTRYYDNPGLLVDMQATASTTDVSVDGNRVTLTPPADFIGTLHVQATVSDGLSESEGVFRIAVTQTSAAQPEESFITGGLSVSFSSTIAGTLSQLPAIEDAQSGMESFEDAYALWLADSSIVEVINPGSVPATAQIEVFDGAGEVLHSFTTELQSEGILWLDMATIELPAEALHGLVRVTGSSGLKGRILSIDALNDQFNATNIEDRNYLTRCSLDNRLYLGTAEAEGSYAELDGESYQLSAFETINTGYANSCELLTSP